MRRLVVSFQRASSIGCRWRGRGGLLRPWPLAFLLERVSLLLPMSPSPQAYLIIRDSDKLTYSCGLPGFASITVDLVSLARALSSSRRWLELEQAFMVVRSDPVPMLGILGYFDEAEAFSVRSLAWQIRHWSRHLLYVDYRRVEDDCRQLAQLLREKVGEKVLTETVFTAIPRGGLVVLGILSYFLGLRPEQLRPRNGDGCQIVVDDCSISGARFHEFLSSSSAEDIIFAHLYSHPDLRKNICRAEPRVRDCLAVHDLRDHAAEFFGPDYQYWQERWETRGAAYWNGFPERLCFPWNETDVAVWNSVAQCVEPGWRLVPPEWCFKNQPDIQRIQLQDRHHGSVRPTPGVLYGDLGEETLIADVTEGRMFVLDGTAREAWKALLNGGSSQSQRDIGELAASGSRPKAELDGYFNEFVKARLLERQNAY